MSAVSLAATIVGLEVPASGKNLELKPYAISGLRTDQDATPVIRQRRRRRRRLRREVRADEEPDARPDLQHRLRAGRRRPPAGQPDAVQPVLPRAARFLSRRPGHLRIRRGRGFGRRRCGSAVNNNTPVLFFSRRIGLNNGRPVPIGGGGRVTGKVGRLFDRRAQHPVGRGAWRPTRGRRTSPSSGSSVTSSDAATSACSTPGATRRAATAGSGETFGIDAPVLGVAQPERQRVFARTRTPASSRTRPATSATSTTTPTATALQLEHLYVGARLQPGGRFPPADRLHAAATRRRGSARGRPERT